MKSTSQYDVAVVGGGPAGSSCATLLARSGLNVLLCDKARFPRDKICGDCINPRSWDFFRALDVAETIRSLNPRILDTVRIAGLGGKEVIIKVKPDAPNPFIVLRRDVLDDLLLRNAMHSGATVLQEAQVVDMIHSDTWEIMVRSDGLDKRHTCTHLVGADGRNSRVANNIAAKVPVSSSRDSGERVGIQWRTAYQQHVGSEVQLYLLEKGYCGMVNDDGEQTNIAMVSTPALAHLALSDFQEFLRRTILKNPMAIRFSQSLEPLGNAITTFPINPISRRVQQSNAFLIGDARQTVEPFTGEGVCLALQDGIQVARTILSRCEKRIPAPSKPKKTFWVNRVYSPILRNQSYAELLVSVASKVSWLPALVARTVFHLGN
jgi:geranylgeranyl reductase family protein